MTIRVLKLDASETGYDTYAKELTSTGHSVVGGWAADAIDGNESNDVPGQYAFDLNLTKEYRAYRRLVTGETNATDDMIGSFKPTTTDTRIETLLDLAQADEQKTATTYTKKKAGTSTVILSKTYTKSGATETLQ